MSGAAAAGGTEGPCPPRTRRRWARRDGARDSFDTLKTNQSNRRRRRDVRAIRAAERRRRRARSPERKPIKADEDSVPDPRISRLRPLRSFAPRAHGAGGTHPATVRRRRARRARVVLALALARDPGAVRGVQVRPVPRGRRPRKARVVTIRRPHRRRRAPRQRRVHGHDHRVRAVEIEGGARPPARDALARGGDRVQSARRRDGLHRRRGGRRLRRRDRARGGLRGEFASVVARRDEGRDRGRERGRAQARREVAAARGDRRGVGRRGDRASSKRSFDDDDANDGD